MSGPFGLGRKLACSRQRIEAGQRSASGSHLDGLSPFRPCGRDRVEFFKSTGWAFYIQEAVPMRLPDAGRLIESNLFEAVSGQCDERMLR